MTSALERRLARLAEAHAAATAPAAWVCHRPGCPRRGVEHPASSTAEAEAELREHVRQRHADEAPVPEDLEQRRAAWVKAGRPPLGTC